MNKRYFLLAGTALMLSACGQASRPANMPNQVKIGKPYSVMGETYYPEYDPQYDRTGTASWYGPGFHGKSTATGEAFDQHDLTAAHPTLPMPSLVRVTNLENGKSAIVRVNDRGPFKSKRLIDLSKGSAEELGISGLGKVRVQYLKQETEQYWAQMKLRTDDIRFAKNDPYAPGPDSPMVAVSTGEIVPQDSSAPAQMQDSAPIMSVASADLKSGSRAPKRKWSIIGDAEAAEPGPVSLVNEDNEPIETLSEENREQIATGRVALPSSIGESDLPPPPGANNVNNARSAPSAAKTYGNVPKDMPFAVGESRYVKPPEGGDAPTPPVTARQAGAVAPAAGGWVVQAGSFSSLENARKLAKRLERSGPVDISPVEVNGQTWQRVRVGPFASPVDAENALSEATAAGASGARILKH